MSTMTEDKTYNGWTNYETWCVNLWLSNDQGSDEMVRELVAETVADPPHTSEYWNEEQTRRYNVADAIKDLVEEHFIPDLGATLAANLVNAALSEVDWHEIADAWLEK